MTEVRGQRSGVSEYEEDKSMSKKIFSLALGVMLLALNVPTEAQQPAVVPLLGVLGGDSPSAISHHIEAFRDALRKLGYVEGKNIVIYYRWAEGNADRLNSLAAELVRLKVNVIFASGGGQSVLAAKKATKTIPIVMVDVGDPVAFGLIHSLAKPGGNITGLSTGAGLGLQGKRLELLKESFPKISRVAVLWNPNNPGSVVIMKETEGPARSLSIKLQSVEMRDPSDLEQAFSAMKRDRAEALTTLNSPLLINQLKQIVDLAAKSRLPAVYGDSRWVEGGGLMSYATNRSDMYSRAATYVDKILKGAKPADLPVEQPIKFEFIINLKTAKQIGLTIPPNVLVRADRVIK